MADPLRTKTFGRNFYPCGPSSGYVSLGCKSLHGLRTKPLVGASCSLNNEAAVSLNNDAVVTGCNGARRASDSGFILCCAEFLSHHYRLQNRQANWRPRHGSKPVELAEQDVL